MVQTSHPTVVELSAQEARKTVHTDVLSFTTTADLAPLDALVGQERAIQALEVGLSMQQQGYNIFVSGFQGLGAQAQIEAQLRAKATHVADPWRLGLRAPLSSSRDRRKPLRLKRGRAPAPTGHGRFVTDLQETLPKRSATKTSTRTARTERQVRTGNAATAGDVESDGPGKRLWHSRLISSGNVMIVPIRDDRPMSQEELTASQRRGAARSRSASKRMSCTNCVAPCNGNDNSCSASLRKSARWCAITVPQLIAPRIDDLKQRHAQPYVHRYLDAVQEHVLSHLDAFKGEEQAVPDAISSSMP